VTSITTGISPLRTSNSNQRKQTHDEILRWYLIYRRVVNSTSVLGRQVTPTPGSSYVLWLPYNYSNYIMKCRSYRDQKGKLICHKTHSFREAKNSTARQEIPHILWTSNVHHRVHKILRCHPEPDKCIPRSPIRLRSGPASGHFPLLSP
jgi:hypothetical protein